MTNQFGNKTKKYTFYAAILLSGVLYYIISYDLARTNFVKLFVLYTLLFAVYLFILKYKKRFLTFNNILALTVFFNMIFFFAVPELSNDFYRFIWDGKMFLAGINPIEYTPAGVFKEFPELKTQSIYMRLFNGMGKLSQHNYTCYPPVHQYVFIFGAWLFPASIKGSIIIMRIILILASMGSLWAGKRLLQRTNFPIHNLALLALNPLFIIETTGNLHFESLMVFFFLFSLLFVYQSKHIVSSLFFSLACSVKLIPLIFAPLLLKKIRKKSFIYFSAAGIVFIILFLPFYKESVLQNFFSSINLYFQTFEFNASIYYIIREIGYLIKGYNIIKTAGIVLAAISFTGVMLIAYKNKTNKHRSFFNGLLLTLTIYYFLATTVHPWYILPLITLSAFSNYKYNLIWSYTIIFSYYAYSNPDFRENMFLIAIEYIPVYGYLVFELLKQHRAKKTNTLS